MADPCSTLGIGLDVDGVLADYLAGVDALHLSDADSVYHTIAASTDFWATLPAYPHTAGCLQRLRGVDRLYFLTKRYGRAPRQQTIQWLSQWLPHPSVLIVHTEADKGRFADLLHLTTLIDDREEVFTHLPRDCQGLLLDRSWNRNADLPRRVQRILTLEEGLIRLGV